MVKEREKKNEINGSAGRVRGEEMKKKKDKEEQVPWGAKEKKRKRRKLEREGLENKSRDFKERRGRLLKSWEKATDGS